MTPDLLRERFEIWLITGLPDCYHEEFLWKNTSGEYNRRYTQVAWEGWQACKEFYVPKISNQQPKDKKYLYAYYSYDTKVFWSENSAMTYTYIGKIEMDV